MEAPQRRRRSNEQYKRVSEPEGTGEAVRDQPEDGRQVEEAQFGGRDLRLGPEPIKLEQAIGHNEEADRLLVMAQDMDPETVADVLREHDPARAPDARFQATAD
jgi:hypothetical protein